MNDKPTGKDYVGSDDLYADVQRTMRLVAEMNTGYHTEAEVRDFLREITRSDVPDTVRVFPPCRAGACRCGSAPARSSRGSR